MKIIFEILQFPHFPGINRIEARFPENENLFDWRGEALCKACSSIEEQPILEQYWQRRKPRGGSRGAHDTQVFPAVSPGRNGVGGRIYSPRHCVSTPPARYIRPLADKIPFERNDTHEIQYTDSYRSASRRTLPFRASLCEAIREGAQHFATGQGRSGDFAGRRIQILHRRRQSDRAAWKRSGRTIRRPLGRSQRKIRLRCSPSKRGWPCEGGPIQRAKAGLRFQRIKRQHKGCRIG